VVLTDLSIRNPAGVVVAVLLACFLGIYAFVKLPVQLFPDVEEPALTIATQWRAAAPSEVEAQIVEPQEQALRGTPGLKELNAFANAGNAWLTLRFAPGTDMQATLIEVISRMNQLPPMPRDSQAPVISMGEDGGDSPNRTLSYFFVQLLPGTAGPIEDYRERVEKVFRPRIESVPGVSSVRFATGGPEELQILFDANRAAELGVQIPRVATLAGNADDVSGGFVDIGRRQYTVRFAGRYTPEELSQLVLEWRDGRPVRLGDIATVSVKRRDRTDLAAQNGNPAIGIRVMKENGANVLETLAAVKAEIEELRVGPLAQMGLTIAQSFDPSVFINEAIDLVTGNLLSGVVLAILALWYFVRDRRATLLVGLSIPICLLVTLVALELTGRTLNVISLAGLAFGVGQALDTAIVVLEAIAHRRSQGMNTRDAALAASKQVWPALLASTVTAVIVFLPLVFMRDSASQLFADLALTISIAVVASLLVAVTVLPVAASRWLKADSTQAANSERWEKLAALIVSWTDTRKRRIATVAALLVAPAVLTWVLLPPLDYLPPVKRDAIDGFFQFPPGASIDTIDREIIQVMTRRLEPYMKGEQEPKLKNYYFLLWPGGGTIGVRPVDPNRIDELGKLINEKIVVGFPDTEVFASQGNLFGGFGDGRNIDFQIQSSDFAALLPVARRAQELIKEKLPGADVQATQGFDLAEPELRLTPDDRRISEVGWSRGELGTVVRALGDGAWVGEYFDGERRLDMILRAQNWSSPEELSSVLVSTPAGATVPLGELVGVESTVGPTGLRRVDGRRTVGLNVSPPKTLSLQQAIDILKTEVEPEVRKMLPADGTVRYAGNAGNLKAALSNMRENLTLAFLVLFMVMAALFRSAKDSLFVMLTIPLASFGGVLGLWTLRLFTFQTLDLLTMVGFVVLMGLVVNNAILLTDETRAGERSGLSRREAIATALRTRTRPIVSITLTTLLGMLPMVVVPGPGSALYRGLGAVICGGMALNAVFTLVLLPALLRLTERDASPSTENSPHPDPDSEPEAIALLAARRLRAS
jgi:multidrug efflux pump subunit AcrB